MGVAGNFRAEDAEKKRFFAQKKNERLHGTQAATDRRLTKGRNGWTEKATKQAPASKGSKRTLSVPAEGLRNGAGS